MQTNKYGVFEDLKVHSIPLIYRCTPFELRGFNRGPAKISLINSCFIAEGRLFAVSYHILKNMTEVQEIPVCGTATRLGQIKTDSFVCLVEVKSYGEFSYLYIADNTVKSFVSKDAIRSFYVGQSVCLLKGVSRGENSVAIVSKTEHEASGDEYIDHKFFPGSLNPFPDDFQIVKTGRERLSVEGKFSVDVVSIDTENADGRLRFLSSGDCMVCCECNDTEEQSIKRVSTLCDNSGTFDTLYEECIGALHVV